MTSSGKGCQEGADCVLLRTSDVLQWAGVVSAYEVFLVFLLAADGVPQAAFIDYWSGAAQCCRSGGNGCSPDTVRNREVRGGGAPCTD